MEVWNNNVSSIGIFSLLVRFSGFIFKDFLLETKAMNFGNHQSYFDKFDHSAIPLWFLLITPILVLISIPISFYLFIKEQQTLRRI